MKAFVTTTIIIFLLATMGWFVYDHKKEKPNNAFLARVAESSTSIVYVLNNKRWTEFPVPAETKSIRLITNADLPVDFDTTPADKWNYAIEYQLVDKNGNVIVNKQFHFVTKLTKYVDPRFKNPITESFYFNLNPVPTDARLAVLNLKGIQNVAVLRVRIKSMDPVLKNIVLRVSVPDNIAENKLNYFWLRMSEEKKSVIAKGNIYPHDLLRKSEIQNLLSMQEKPIGPLGQPNRNYLYRTLYVSNEVIADEIPATILPSGIFIDDIVRGVIPLSEGDHLVRLSISSAGFGKDPLVGSVIHIRWIGRVAQERLSYDVVWKGGEINWTHSFRGGMLEIMAPGHLVVRAFIDGKNTKEITPVPLYVRTYVSDKGFPIQYKINHIANQPTLFRVNLGFLMSLNGMFVDTPSIQYACLNKKGDILIQGQITLNSLHSKSYELVLLSREPTNSEKNNVLAGDEILIIKQEGQNYFVGFLKAGKYVQYKMNDKTLIEMIKDKSFSGEIESDVEIINRVNTLVSSLKGQMPSNYDRVAYEPFGSRLSNTDSYFFILPPEVTTIKFTSDQPVLIDAYNRPYDLIREVKVPEDSYLDDPLRYKQPAWYALKPIDEQKLVLNKHSLLITRQYRPADENTDLLQGQYEWKDYHPRGNWLGKNLLTPHDNFGVLRENALPTVYKPVQINKIVPLHFYGLNGSSIVEPSIIYTRSNTQYSPIRIYIDNQLSYQGEIGGNSGEMRLPAIKTGVHRIMVQYAAGSDAVFYVSHSSLVSTDMLKRLVNKIDGSELVFDYEKNSKVDEILSLRYYVPLGTKKRSIIDVQVDAMPNKIIGPLRSYSFLKRRFDIRPNEESKIAVLSSGGQAVDKGENFSIPLGEDIPPGKYQIRVRLIKGEPGYVSLSRMRPGKFEERSIFIEPEVQHVQHTQ